MNIPKYLYDGINDKTVYFTYINSGSYSAGFCMEFTRNKPEDIPAFLFLKLIPVCDDKDNENFIKINFQKKIYTSSKKMFDNEVLIQTHIYENRKYHSGACVPIQDYFILTKEQENTSNIEIFLKSLKFMEMTDVLDVGMLLQSMTANIQLGVIIMPFINGSTGYKMFSKMITFKKDFGKFFDSNDIVLEILGKQVRTRQLFCIIQIMYRIKELFHISCIHDDLHLANIIINDEEICTSQAYLPNGNINPIFVGRVYLIDYGHAYIDEHFNYIKNKYIKDMRKIKPTFEYNPNNFYQVVELIGRKIVKDGYNKKTNTMTEDWYMYDWYFNIFFDKNLNINKPVIKQMDRFIKDFENGLMTYNSDMIVKTPKNDSICCPFFM